jgi:ABC-type bacteriocin/lantibiotic exporter with double-glycine peptidase domain
MEIIMNKSIYLVKKGFSYLEKSDRRKVYFMIPITVFLSFLDLLGVVLLGTVGTLAFKVVSSDSKPTRLEVVLQSFLPGNLSTGNLTLILAIMAFFVLATKTVCQGLINYKLAKFQARLESEISAKAFKKIIHANASTFNSKKYSDYQQALSFGSFKLVSGLIGTVIVLAGDLSSTILMGIFAFYASPIAFFSALAIFGLIYLLINGPIYRMSQNYGRESSSIYILMTEQLLEYFKGIKEINVYGKAHKLSEEYRIDKLKSSMLNQKIQWIASVSRYFLEIAILFAGAAVAAILVMTSDIRRSVTVVVIFLAIGFRLIPNIQRIQNAIVTIRIAEGATEGLFDILDNFPESTGIRKKPQTKGARFDFIEVSDLSFQYSEGATTLSNISFKLPKNCTLAILGESGSGKTTLADLIAGINSPNEGSIRFSESEQSTKSIGENTPSIAYVSQNSSLFGRNIYENIAFGTNELLPDKAKVRSILNNLNLDFLFAMEEADGLREIRSDGTNLSGGERQRIAIARAEYADTDLIIFDEPTSSLDTLNKNKVIDYISRINSHKTIIIVTHTLDLLDYCDFVLLLNKGKMDFYGTLEEYSFWKEQKN